MNRQALPISAASRIAELRQSPVLFRRSRYVRCWHRRQPKDDFPYGLALTGGQAEEDVEGFPLQVALPGGTITVNTTARSIQLNNLAFGYNAGSVVGAATFSMSGSGSYSSNTNPGGFGGMLTGNCTGGSCGAGAAATGGYAGRFTGTTGTGIGLVYGAVTTAAVGPPAMSFIGGTVAAAFKR